MVTRPLLCFLCLGVLLGAAVGLTVGPVRLLGRSYITYRLNNTYNNSVIVCDYKLDDGEEVSRVFWKFLHNDEVAGEYEWSPTTEGKASGRLLGVVNLTRDDGALELTELRYNLSGLYSCGVQLTSGEKKEAQPWEVLIVDINRGSSLKHFTHGCFYLASFQSPTVFPEPTMKAGMYSKLFGGYLKEVSSMEWKKVLYPNESMAYSFNNFTFTIDSQTPEDIVFEVSMGITKASGEYISLGSLMSNSSSWSEHGCPELKEGKNKEVSYFPGASTTCRGGRKSTTKATIACKRGYQAGGAVRTVVLRCDGTSMTWKPEAGHTARDEDLVCVEDTTDNGGGSGSPRTALLSCSLFVVSLLVVLLLDPSHR